MNSWLSQYYCDYELRCFINFVSIIPEPLMRIKKPGTGPGLFAKNTYDLVVVIVVIVVFLVFVFVMAFMFSMVVVVVIYVNHFALSFLAA